MYQVGQLIGYLLVIALVGWTLYSVFSGKNKKDGAKSLRVTKSDKKISAWLFALYAIGGIVLGLVIIGFIINLLNK